MTNSARQFPTTMAARLQELAEVRTTLLTELEDGNFDPQYAEADRWSVGEIAYHLYLVETRINGLLKNLLGSDKRGETAGEEKLRAEWELTSSRATNPEIRVKAPAGTLPEQPPPLAESIAMLKRSRLELLSTISEVNLNELAAVTAPHPIEAVGILTGAGWLSLIAHHEMRHTRQIRNLKAQQVGSAN
ncbi:MAG: DinB family protein [Acidobacteriota bacterium]